ncbi:MAG: serine/threonine-protein kinase [Myxococcales bacterium]
MSSEQENVADPFTGKVVLGRYHVVLQLARGGQGTVHLARAEGAAGVARPVVIKRVLEPITHDKQARARFVSEARITARLRHPDIVSIVEFERQRDKSYLMVLEYVHGYDLWRWARYVQMRNGEIPANLLAYVCMRVLDALHYSHSLRDHNGQPTPIIHRDISGGNVLIDVDGHVKLTDFGIAAVVAPSADPDRVRRHTVQGKLGYIAPELFVGAPPSPASDIYACGVMLHALLLGRNEFHAPDPREAEEKANFHLGSRLDQLRRDVSPAGADVIARALAKDPKERFESAAVFSAELRRAFEVDLAEARDAFALLVESDFEDPEFSRRMGVLPLRQIDAAWRRHENETTDSSLRFRRSSFPSLRPTPTTSAVSEDVTRHDGGRAAPSQPAPAPAPEVPVFKRSERLPQVTLRTRTRYEELGWTLAIVVSVALVVIVGAFLYRTAGTDEVLYVEAQNAGAQAVDVETATAPTPTEALKPAQQEAPSKGDSLTERFAQQGAEVSRCFHEATPAATAPKLTKLAIIFEIEPAGSVARATLEPKELRVTPLGKCLLGVARQTNFGRQPGFMRFRIPISTQVN